MKIVKEKADALTKSYELAIADGMKSIPIVLEFHRLFPGAASSISYYTGESGETRWDSNAGLHERYILSMQFKIRLDQTRTKIVGFDEPRFHLIEVERVSPGLNGTHIIKYGALEERFGSSEWKKLVKSDGDFSVLGVRLEKTKPVFEFSKVLPSR